MWVANVINASAERGGYSKIHLSILLPNKLQIILDNIAVLNEQKRERGGSRFENRFDDLTP